MVNNNVPLKKSGSSLSTFISEQWENYRKHFGRNRNSVCPVSNDRHRETNSLCQRIFDSSCSESTISLANKKTYVKYNPKYSNHTYIIAHSSDGGSDTDHTTRTQLITKANGYYEIYKNKKNNIYSSKPVSKMCNAPSATYYCQRSDIDLSGWGCMDADQLMKDNGKIKVQVHKNKGKENPKSGQCIDLCQCPCANATQKVRCLHEGCNHNQSQNETKKKKKKKICQCCVKKDKSESEYPSECSCMSNMSDLSEDDTTKNDKKDKKKREKEKKKKEKQGKKEKQKEKKGNKKGKEKKTCRCACPSNQKEELDDTTDKKYVICPRSNNTGQCCYKRCNKCFCKPCPQKGEKSAEKTTEKTEKDISQGEPKKSKECTNANTKSVGQCICGEAKEGKEDKVIIHEHGGITNSNTILYPKPDEANTTSFSCKETLESVRMMIKMESRQNYRNINNILNELKKQRKDIEDLKKICIRGGVEKKKSSFQAYPVFSQSYGDGVNKYRNTLESNNCLREVKVGQHRNSLNEGRTSPPRPIIKEEKKTSPLRNCVGEEKKPSPTRHTLNEGNIHHEEFGEGNPRHNSLPTSYTKYLTKNILEEKDDHRNEKSQVYIYPMEENAMSSQAHQCLDTTKHKNNGKGKFNFWKKKDKD